jgi:hypothetical protein
MRISRIFRKYSRVLLLVFMSLLLVVFLLGDVIGRAGRNRQMQDVEIGQAFGKPIFLSQTHQAQADFELTARLGMRTPPVVSEDLQEQNVARYLLMEEARRAGIVVGRQEIIEGLGQAPGLSIALDRIRQDTGRSLNSIYDSIARVVATTVLARYQAGALATASLPEIEHAYCDQYQEARILVSVIDAKAFLPDIPEPTEAELQAHFEECKDRVAAHTDQARVCGYRIPDRVQVEYLTVDPDAIKDEVRISARERLRYYEENQQKYTKQLDESTPLAPGDTAEPQKIQLTYEEVEDRVRDDCRAAKAIQEAQRLVNDIHREARLPWDSAPLGEDDVRQAPPADAIVSFEELRTKFSSIYPVIYRKTELITERDLRRERGFGRASAVVDRQPVPAPTLAFHVEGLPPPEPDDRTPILRVDEPGPVVLETRTVDQNAGPIPYQAYVFRVTRVAPSGPPASLDDVRAQVTEDVKEIKALNLAGEQARALAEQARQTGLKEAVADAQDLKRMMGMKADELVGPPEPEDAQHPSPPDLSERYLAMLEPFEPEQFLRQARPLKNIGYAPELHEQVFAPVAQGGPDLTQEHPVIVAPLAKTLKYAVVEVLEIKPMYQGDFELKRDELEAQAYAGELQPFWYDWFNPKNILARTGFTPKIAAEQ